MLNKTKRKYVIYMITLAMAFTLFVANAKILGTTSLNTVDTEHSSYINTVEMGSLRYEQPYKGSIVDNRMDLVGFEKLLENERLEIWYRSETVGIRIVDKSTGYIWGGLKEDKPENMNSRWSSIGNSLVSIDYFNKEGIENNTGLNTQDHKITYAVNGDTVKFDVNMTDLSISFTFSMQLKESSILFSMDSQDIKEDQAFTIGKLSFIPFLGAVQPTDNLEGYVFLPDGPGALMRFSSNSSFLAPFDKRVYGKDYGIDILYETNDLKSKRPNDFATDEQTVHMPVFGMVHGVKQNAWFARILDGEEYASINAVPSGMQTDYTWAASKFIFRQKYSQPMSRSGAGVQVVQKQPNSLKPAIEYFFLSGNDADYTGMARLYRDSLIKEGKLGESSTSTTSNLDIPLQLDFITSDIEKSFLFNKELDVTNTKKIEEAVDYFNGLGISNLDVVLMGWQQGGLNGNKKSDITLKNSIGSVEALKTFLSRLSEKTTRLSLYNDPVTAKSIQLNTRQEASISISQSSVKVLRENNKIWLNETYFIKPQIMADRIDKFTKLLADNGIDGLALKGSGTYLYAEHLKGEVLTRQEALNLVETTLANAAEKVKLTLYDGNDYTWKYADALYDIPMVSSQLIFETDTVPFMQMVLKGSVQYFAPYTNISFFSRSDLLKHIEYGSYPSFLMTGLGNFELRQTPISEYSSTRYEDWNATAVEYYNEINAVLSQVEGRKIENREVVEAGVVKVDYEGGRSVVVNYTNESIEIDGETIAPRSAVAMGVTD